MYISIECCVQTEFIEAMIIGHDPTAMPLHACDTQESRVNYYGGLFNLSFVHRINLTGTQPLQWNIGK